MSVQDRIEALKQRHAELEESLQKESSRPHPDDLVIKDLKLQKLRIKDEIQALRR